MKTVENGTLLGTLDEIGDWIASDGEPVRVLTNIACLIGNCLNGHACSIYLLSPDAQELILSGTVGLRQDAVGRVRMPLSDGLTGLVAEQNRPVVVMSDAARQPRFRYFPEAGEDPYDSFLGVPVLNGRRLQGVLVLQTIGARRFRDEEIRMLAIGGRQLGPYLAQLRGSGRFLSESLGLSSMRR